MILVRLGSVCARNYNLSQRFLPRTSTLNFSSKSEKAGTETPIKLVEKDNNDEPAVYSRTKAYTHLARNSFFQERNMPDCQPHIITFSLVCFMIYFFILREENDIDDILRTPLETRFPGIEKTVRR